MWKNFLGKGKKKKKGDDESSISMGTSTSYGSNSRPGLDKAHSHNPQSNVNKSYVDEK